MFRKRGGRRASRFRIRSGIEEVKDAGSVGVGIE